MTEESIKTTYNERSFVEKLVDAVPPWSLGAIGSLLTLALVFKVIGIDFAGPINSYSQLQVKMAEAQMKGMTSFTDTSELLTALVKGQEQALERLAQSVSRASGAQSSMLQTLDARLKGIEDEQVALQARLEVMESAERQARRSSFDYSPASSFAVTPTSSWLER